MGRELSKLLLRLNLRDYLCKTLRFYIIFMIKCIYILQNTIFFNFESKDTLAFVDKIC